MKKLALTVAITLMSVVGLISCSENKTDLTSNNPVQEGKINIRYYNMDSVANHYLLLEKLNADSEEIMRNYQARERRYATELQNMGNSIEQKVRTNGYLSQQSYESDMKKFQDRQAAIERELGNLQGEIARQSALQQQQLLDSINNFLNAYNEVNNFDAILIAQPGMYFNPELDITDEIVSGLNARYKGEIVEKKAEEAPAAEATLEKK